MDPKEITKSAARSFVISLVSLINPVRYIKDASLLLDGPVEFIIGLIGVLGFVMLPSVYYNWLIIIPFFLFLVLVFGYVKGGKHMADFYVGGLLGKVVLYTLVYGVILWLIGVPVFAFDSASTVNVYSIKINVSQPLATIFIFALIVVALEELAMFLFFMRNSPLKL